jgi:hypothetical protein
LTATNSHAYNVSKRAEASRSTERIETWQKRRQEKQEMDNEVKPTWRLAWGLWWRMFLIGLGISVIIALILFAVGLLFIPWSLFAW